MRKILYPSLLAATLPTACQHDQDLATPDATFGPCAGPSASAAGRVVVQYREQLSAGAAPAPQLRCRDDVRHSCGNYYLPQVLTATGFNLGISFSSPTEPTICLTNIDYAHSTLDLSSLAPGTYAVAWQAGGRRTTGSINVLADRVEVQSCDSNTVAVRYPVTYRLPATTLWGVAYARTAAAQAVVPAILDSLRREGAQVLRLPPGHYSYFEVDATGQLVATNGPLSGQPASAIVTPILLSYSGNFARLKGVLKRKPQAADLSVGLSSAHGEYAY